MNRIDIINYLISKNNYKSYLEIGVQTGVSFNGIEVGFKIGVDPDPKSKATIHLTSDNFFKQNKLTFDIIFVDGMHEHSFVQRDIENSLAILNEGGTIVCHDMNPTSYLAQKVPRETKIWNGDCWKAFVRLRQRSDLKMCVVNSDHGCGIIQVGEQEPLKIITNRYQDFDNERVSFLNLISVEKFKELY